MNTKLLLVLVALVVISLFADARRPSNRKHRSLADFLELVDEVMADAEGSTMCATTGLNMRSQPCTNAALLLTIPAGAQVTTLPETKNACGYNWVKVSYGGKTGYSATNYLSSCGGGSSSGGSIDVSRFPTSYSTSGYTYTGRKAQVLHFLKEKFTASATTYSSHSNGPLSSADLWTSGARYANDNRNMPGMNNLADYIAANLKGLGLQYVIWKQRIYTTSNPQWRQMENRGSITQNHFDHVHITFA